MSRWTEEDLLRLGSKSITKAKIPINVSKFQFHIGIDPGNSTGFAVYDRIEKKFLVVETLDFWMAYSKAQAYSVKDTRIIVEVSKTKANWQKDKSTTTSVNIGGVIKESKLLAEGFRRLGFYVETPHPRGKVDASYFKRVTGYQGRTNEHMRDAGLLCFMG